MATRADIVAINIIVLETREMPIALDGGHRTCARLEIRKPMKAIKTCPLVIWVIGLTLISGVLFSMVLVVFILILIGVLFFGWPD